jgi:hypothetical protein
MVETPVREPGDPAFSGTQRSPGDLGWVTAFDDPVVVRAAERASRRRTFFTGPWPARTLFALVTGALATWVAIDLSGRESSGPPVGVPATTAPTAVPTPEATQPAQPAKPTSPTAPVTPTVPGIRLPDSCRELFGTGVTKQLTGEGLGLVTTIAGNLPHEIGSGDRRLRTLMGAESARRCYWVDDKTSGQETGVLTAIGFVTDGDRKSAEKRLRELKLNRIEENGGVRYFGADTDIGGRPIGESHFFRDDVWFATNWYGYGPRGYTASMVGNVFYGE